MSDPLGDWLDDLVSGPGTGATDAVDGVGPAIGLVDLQRVATGAVHAVYRARDPRLNRTVALKVSRIGDDDAAAMLRAEATTTARLEHPGVLPVHRVEEVDGRVILELRWGSDRTLRDASEALRLEPPPLAERLGLLRGLADVLAHAHRLGIVHGDVHPANVLIDGEGPACWLCDWGDVSAGHPGYAAPERLRGGPPTTAGDVHALGVIAWELLTTRELRTRRHTESVGEWVSRTLSLPVPPVPRVEPGLSTLIAEMTGPAGSRPAAAAVSERLDEAMAGLRSRAIAAEGATTCLDRARAALGRERELERRRAEEERVVAVLRAKVPGYAPPADKRPILEAEDRVEALVVAATDARSEALDALAQARLLAPDPAQVDEVAAEVAWERLREAEAAGDARSAGRARRTLLDGRTPAQGRIAAHVRAPGIVTLSADVSDATVTVAEVVERGAVLVPEPSATHALPVETLALPPGPYILTISAPGRAAVHLPVLLGRGERYSATVRLWTAAQIGAGWCPVPAGPFRMGGDRGARSALAGCVPYLGDRFALRCCVTSAEYRDFLDDLPVEQAEALCPGEVGLFGERSRYWTHVAGAWTMPAGWDPAWPVMGVSLDDAQAYGRWRSAREGREVRVPTEEEWEKASRGADGRLWPWGNRFDPTFCHMRESRPGVPRPAPVGIYPVDTSVYGVMDTAGGMREWTTSTYQEGQVVMRGGTWGDDADDCRCASRAGLRPGFRMPWVGFRLVTESPRRT